MTLESLHPLPRRTPDFKVKLEESGLMGFGSVDIVRYLQNVYYLSLSKFCFECPHIPNNQDHFKRD